MPKSGILHDYDLMANREQSAAGVTCYICDTKGITFQWADYSGQAMCTKCGAPYQLKWGTDEQEKEGNYPYVDMKDEWIEVAKEYWKETEKFVCYGVMISNKPGIEAMMNWAQEKYPELFAVEKCQRHLKKYNINRFK